jgi:hypothetical protein
MEPWLRVVWPFPHILPGRSPPRRQLATRAARLRSAGRAFEDSAPVVRRVRSPVRAHPPWPLPPLRSLRTALAESSRWKPPQLVGRLSWDSSVRPSIDVLAGPGPSALPPPGRLGMPLPRLCRSRGFAPPQRITVPSSRRRIAACCRSWGSSRFLACRLLPDKPIAARSAFPATQVRTPRRIPSPAAAPRHRGRCTSCGSTASIQPLARPDGAPDQSDGLWPTDCSADLHTWHRSGPLMQAAPRSPHPCGQRHRNPARPGGVATSGPCSTDEFVLARSGMDTGTKPARFFLGFVPLQGPPAAPLRVQPTPPPPKRQGHRAPCRRPVDACRARCDEDPQAPSLGGRRHRQAGILDRTRPLRAVPPGACSHRTGDGIPPRVHPATACAATWRSRSLSGAGVGERFRRAPHGLTRAGSDGRIADLHGVLDVKERPRASLAALFLRRPF